MTAVDVDGIWAARVLELEQQLESKHNALKLAVKQRDEALRACGDSPLAAPLAGIALELEIRNLLKHGTIQKVHEAEARRAVLRKV